MKTLLQSILVLSLLTLFIGASEKPAVSTFTDSPVNCDGLLEEACWQRSADLQPDLVTYSPAYGNALAFRTEVWLAHDRDHLYFAIVAQDPEPGMLKTSVTKRDNIDHDDWVAISLDSMGGRQSACVFRVNPLGVQADEQETASGSDSSPDYVWSSGARVTTTGYAVEIAIPLKSIRFKSGRQVAMNLMVMRHVARSGNKACWPAKKPVDSFLAVHHPLRYDELIAAGRLELIPALTYGALWDRLTPETWSDGQGQGDIGLTAKWGVTSAITMEATVNPDFSQVESDEFQVLVNQRYPIFYTEKRPFFMETAALFNLAASDDSGDYNMFTAVNTRSVVEPDWGGKLSGEAGKTVFGFLLARDRWPEREGGDAATVMFGRLKWNLGADNFAGFLYSGRSSGDERNDVAAADFSWKLKGGHHLAGKGIVSRTAVGDNAARTDGAFTGSWGYYTKALSAFLVMEHVGVDFRMDSAFMLRNGMNRVMGYLSPSYYPAGIPWLKRLNLMLWGYRVHDLASHGDDSLYFIAVRAFFPRQANLRIDWRRFTETWAGTSLKGQYLFAGGQLQLTNALFLYLSIEAGDRILYDLENPLVGSGLSGQFITLLQPNDRLALELSYIYEKMDHPDTGLRLYDVHILRSKNTYQLSRSLFFRALIQYDSSQRRVLSDVLASFTLIPETVIHLGYGSVHEKVDWGEQPMQSSWGSSSFYQTKQSLFFKASYRLRF